MKGKTITHSSNFINRISLLVLVMFLSFSVVNSQATFRACQINSAGNGLIPSTGTGGCAVAPQLTGGTVFPICVSGLATTGVTVQSMNLRMNHTWDGDLEIYLQSPTGQILELSTGNGTTGDNYGTGASPGPYVFTNFSDNTANPFVNTGVSPFAGNFRPEGRINTATCFPANTAANGTFTFANTFLSTANMNGTWNLIFLDNTGGDSGNLLEGQIIFNAPAPAACSFVLPTLPALVVSTGAANCLSNPTSVPVPATTGACAGLTTSFQIQPGGTLTTVPTGATSITIPALAPGSYTINWAIGTVCGACSLPVGTRTQAVTVQDLVPPVIVCPADIVVNLPAGGCRTPVSYNPITATDNCGNSLLTVRSFTQNADSTLSNAFLPFCGGGTGDIWFLRRFTNATGDIFGIRELRVGISNATAGNTMPYTIFTIPTGAAFTVANMTPVLTGVHTFETAITAPTIISIPVIANIPIGVDYVIQVVQSDAQAMRVGWSNGTATGPTFINSCIVTNPTNLANFGGGFATVQWFLRVNGLTGNLMLTSTASFNGAPATSPAPASGSNFEIGTTVITGKATDLAGNMATCSFSITVNEFVPTSNTLVCHDQVNISLDQTCSHAINAGEILEGTDYRCFEKYQVTIAGRTGNVVNGNDIGKILIVTVKDPTSGNSCWGKALIEDKLAPALVCPADITFSCGQNLVPGTIIPTGVRTVSVNNVMPIAAVGMSTGTFTANLPVGETITDINVTLDITHTWVTDLNLGTITSPAGTTVPLWNAAFGAGANSDNMFATFDDEATATFPGTFVPGIVGPLGGFAVNGTFRPATPLSALDGQDPNGVWTLKFNDAVGGDGGNVRNVTLNIATNTNNANPAPDRLVGFPNGLNPSQVTSLGNRKYFAQTGVDNCGATIEYADRTVNLTCSPTNDILQRVIRTWTATDGSGNKSSCSYTISIRKGNLADLVAPPNYDDITLPSFACDGPYPAANSVVNHQKTSAITFSTVTNIPSNAVFSFDAPFNLSTLPAGAVIKDINVVARVNHTNLGQVRMSVVAPNGTSANLVNSNCPPATQRRPSADTAASPYIDLTAPTQVRYTNIDATFDDLGLALACDATSPAIKGCGVRPVSPLNVFNGLNASGNWIIRVEDLVATGGAGGSIQNLQLVVTYTYPDTVKGFTLNGTPLTAAGLCNLSVTYTDDVVPVCGNSYKVLRSWKVIDWCNTTTRLASQVIAVMDLTPPSFAVAPRLEISTNQTTCSAGITLPRPVLSDNCTATGNIAFEVSSSNGTVISQNPIRLANLPLSIQPGAPANTAVPTIVTYSATDECGNQFTCTQQLIVTDKTPPTMNCDEITQVAITYDNIDSLGAAVVFASVFDDGSHDNCSDIRFLVRRMADPCGQDMNNNDEIGGFPDDFQNPDSFPNYFPLSPVPVDETLWGRDFNGDNLIDGIHFFDPAFFGPATTKNTFPYAEQNFSTYYGNYVKFCCEDIGDTVQVLLRGIDDAGNYNTCMVQVYIEDKVRPVCVPPASAIIVCNDPTFNLWQLDRFGSVVVDDNCEYDTTYRVALNLNNCKVGTITRTWTVKERRGYRNTSTCSQTITVTGASDFVVDFPDDVTVGCFADLNNNTIADTLDMINRASTQDGNIQNFGCGVLAVNVHDEIFTTVPGACYKVNRTYTVIDWCVYDPNRANNNCLGNRTPVGVTERGSQRGRIFRESDGQTLANDGVICFTQSIKVIDNAAPTFTACPADKTVGDFSQEVECNGSVLSCDGVYKETVSATDLCQGGVRSGASLRYRWRLFDMSDMSLVKQGTGAILRETRVAGDGDCTPRLRDGLELPYDVQYLLKWEAEDQCGNVGYCEYKVRVVDAKKPSIVCKNGLSAELMRVDLNNDGMPDGGQIAVWASEVLASSGDNCTPTSLLKYGIRRAGTGTGFPRDAQGNPITGVTFSCSDLGPQSVELWAEDLAGNGDFCVATVTIQDNMNAACRPAVAASVSGNIQTSATDNVQAVTVSATINGLPVGTFTSGSNGNYAINTLITGSNYKVKADNDLDPLNGVTTKDITDINAHILGLKTLATPYQLIAADVNKSGTITSLDMLEIRKLILRKSTGFTNNKSWRFVEKNYVFPTPNDPFANDFPEIIDLNNATATNSINWIGMKVGDVNNSVAANQLLGSIIRSSVGTLDLTAEDIKMATGNVYEVKVSTKDFNAMGYQYTLNLDKSAVEVVDIKSADLANMSGNNFGIFNDKGMVTTSWNGTETMSGDKGLYTIVLRAKKDAQLSNVMSVGSQLTAAEAYAKDGSQLDVTLNFNKGSRSVDAKFELYQNQPNPFAGNTVIGFTLPESSNASIRIYDVSGKTLKMINGDFVKGYNQITLTKTELNASGVLYYQLDTPTHSATKKMIIIE